MVSNTKLSLSHARARIVRNTRKCRRPAHSTARRYYQGNVFYSLGYQRGAGGVDSIRRAAAVGAQFSPRTNNGRGSYAGGSFAGGGFGGGGFGTQDDELIFTGTGVILAMTVDADENLVFTMDDALAESGGVYRLEMASGGVPAVGAPATEADAETLGTDLGPLLPGVAVCPATGDVFVARGHAGLTRILKSGGFVTQVGKGRGGRRVVLSVFVC